MSSSMKGSTSGFPIWKTQDDPIYPFITVSTVGMIECKALSADAGRKIHRKHFYCFMDVISHDLLDRIASSGPTEVILITVSDRLSSHVQRDTPLVQAVTALLRSRETSQIVGKDFEIVRQTYSTVFGESRTKFGAHILQ